MTTNKSFFGYSSPQELEKAITKDEDADFIVYTEGICYSSVCSSLPVDEVVARMKRRLSGVGPWTLSEAESFSEGEPNPCPCDQNPATHQHYLFVC